MPLRRVFMMLEAAWNAFGLSLLLFRTLRAVHIGGNFVQNIDNAIPEDRCAEFLLRQQRRSKRLPFLSDLLDI
jgi:hypothetical protein